MTPSAWVSFSKEILQPPVRLIYKVFLKRMCFVALLSSGAGCMLEHASSCLQNRQEDPFCTQRPVCCHGATLPYTLPLKERKAWPKQKEDHDSSAPYPSVRAPLPAPHTSVLAASASVHHA